VLEELRVPTLVKKSQGLLDPTVSGILAVAVTLIVVASVIVVGRLLPAGWAGELSRNCIVGVAALVLVAFPFVLLQLSFFRDRFRPRDKWPRVYRRTCKSCHYHWTWRPGEPQSGLQVRPDLPPATAQEPSRQAAPTTARRPTQPLLCPDCGRTSAFDPWTESAHCPHCGFTPPTGKGQRSYLAAMEKRTHQPLLTELLSHRDGTHVPDPSFKLEKPADALLFFQNYQRALGEDPVVTPGRRTSYLRAYHPQREEILAFAAAYLYLRHGDRANAEERLRRLVQSCPEFVDAWVWLSATTDDAAAWQACLEEAIRLDAAHPLARDALAIAQNQVSLDGERRDLELETSVTQCTQCGGALRYEPGAQEVGCPYCGHAVKLAETKQVEARAKPVSHLQLERRYQGHTWGEVQRVVSCQTCGARLTMTEHLAQVCAFCGSTSVLVEGSRRTFERPDGLVAFQIDERQAANAIHKACGKGQVAGLRGVYLPFWVFDGDVEIRWWIQSDLESPLAPLHQRSDYRRYGNLVLPAVDAPPPSFLEHIEPFDLSAMIPYAPSLLADWPAQLYSLDVEGVAEEASNAMMALARLQSGPPLIWQNIAWPTRRRSRPPNAMRSFHVHSVTYQLLLLPVWVAPVRQRDERHLALVNGQSGQASLCP
jgi:Zn finger protein HypA/HybF involved in hydrogenase expression